MEFTSRELTKIRAGKFGALVNLINLRLSIIQVRFSSRRREKHFREEDASRSVCWCALFADLWRYGDRFSRELWRPIAPGDSPVDSGYTHALQR
jgi:hypothetical protein